MPKLPQLTPFAAPRYFWTSVLVPDTVLPVCLLIFIHRLAVLLEHSWLAVSCYRTTVEKWSAWANSTNYSKTWRHISGQNKKKKGRKKEQNGIFLRNNWEDNLICINLQKGLHILFFQPCFNFSWRHSAAPQLCWVNWIQTESCHLLLLLWKVFFLLFFFSPGKPERGR